MGSTKWARAEPRILNRVLTWSKFSLHKQLRKERTSCVCFRRASWLFRQLSSALFSWSPPMWSGHIGSLMGSRAHWLSKEAGQEASRLSEAVHELSWGSWTSDDVWTRQCSIGKASTLHLMLAFGSCPLGIEGGDLDVQVNQAGMENLLGVTMGNVVPTSQKGKRKGLCQVAKHTFPPAPSTSAEGQGWELCSSWQGMQGSSQPCNVSGSRKFIGSEGELKHKGIQRVLRHAHLWIVHFTPELLLGKSLLAQTTANLAG